MLLHKVLSDEKAAEAAGSEEKMKKKLLAVLGLTLALSTGITGITGCAGNSSVAATINGKDITLGEVKTYVKYQQALYEQVYSVYLNQDIDWTAISNEETKQTMGDDAVSDFLNNYKEMVIVASHASDYGISLSDEENEEIKAAAKEFLEENSKAALKEMGATEETVISMLTYMTLQSRVQEAMRATADQNVTEKEAAQKTISYVTISKAGTEQDEDGNTVELTEDELAELKEKAETLSESGDDFDTVAKDASYTVQTESYGEDDRGILEESVYEAADKLKEGEISDVIETDAMYYVVRMDSLLDEEATEERKEEILEEREEAAYDALYKEWSESGEFVTVDRVWNSITLKNKFTIVNDETEETTEDDTEETTDSDATTKGDSVTDGDATSTGEAE